MYLNRLDLKNQLQEKRVTNLAVLQQELQSREFLAETLTTLVLYLLPEVGPTVAVMKGGYVFQAIVLG